MPAICANPKVVTSVAESARRICSTSSPPEKLVGDSSPACAMRVGLRAEYSKPHISTWLTLKSADALSGSLPKVSQHPEDPYSKASSSQIANWPPPPKAIESAKPS